MSQPREYVFNRRFFFNHMKGLVSIGYPIAVIGYPIAAIGYPIADIGYPIAAIGYSGRL